MTAGLSKQRQQLWRAHAAVGRTLRRLQRSQPMIQGSFYLLHRKCGKPNCRCASGRPADLHDRWVLTRSEQGRHRLYSVPKEERAAVRQGAAEYRHYLRARAVLVQRQAGLLARADEIAAHRLLLWPTKKTEPPP